MFSCCPATAGVVGACLAGVSGVRCRTPLPTVLRVPVTQTAHGPSCCLRRTGLVLLRLCQRVGCSPCPKLMFWSVFHWALVLLCLGGKGILLMVACLLRGYVSLAQSDSVSCSGWTGKLSVWALGGGDRHHIYSTCWSFCLDDHIGPKGAWVSS